MGRKIPRAVKTSPEIRSTRQSKFNNHKQKPRHVSITDTPSTITVLTITAHRTLPNHDPEIHSINSQLANNEKKKTTDSTLDLASVSADESFVLKMGRGWPRE